MNKPTGFWRFLLHFKKMKCKIKLKYIIFNACRPDADLIQSDLMSEEQKDDHNLCDFDLKIK